MNTALRPRTSGPDRRGPFLCEIGAMLPSVMSFGGAKTFGFLILLCASLACCSDKTEYQTGTLLDINHHDSSRMIGNAQTGSVQSVTDREYEISVRVGNMTYVG